MSSYSEWTKKDIPNRNRHVLFELLKRPDVEKIVSVDFMPFTKKRALRMYMEDFFHGDGEVISKTAFDVLRKVNKKLYIYTSVRSALFSEDAFYAHLKKRLEKIDMNTFVLWSYFPYYVGYFDYFSSAQKKVFDTVDDWSKHPNFSEKKEQLEANYKTIDKKADVVFTVSEKLKDIYPSNNNVHWIPNGVDFDHFQKKIDKEDEVIKRLKEIKEPRVAYVGIIQKRVDFELVARVARMNPRVSFVFFGPLWPDAEDEKVRSLDNVHLLGPVRYGMLPKALSLCSVGMIPHVVDAFTDTMNPLKMYDYLATGLPVVTTSVAGVGKYSDVVTEATSTEAFSSAVQHAILYSKNEHMQDKRREVAKKCSWNRTVNAMMSVIKDT